MLKIVDDQNRVTYCCVKLGPHMLPVYQPGTIMFASAIKFGSALNIRNQNCTVLETQAAFFLARFMCFLSGTYSMLCSKEG